MTILAAVKCGLKIKDIIKVMEKIRPIEGRLEKIGHIKNNSKIILDYAHTPEALLTALNNLKEQENPDQFDLKKHVRNFTYYLRIFFLFSGGIFGRGKSLS